jgi:hypothetical protein
VPCQRCGASLAFSPLAERARCAFCNDETPVPAEARAAAKRWLEVARAAHTREREVLLAASVKRRMASASNATALWIVVSVALVVLSPVVFGVASLSAGSGAAVTLGLAFVGNRLVRAIQDMNSPRPSWRRDPIVVPEPDDARTFAARCEACGGGVQFPLRLPVTVCPFCAATLLAPSAVEQQAARAADQRVLQTRLASERALSEFYARGSQATVSAGVALAFFATIGLLAMGLVLAISEHPVGLSSDVTLALLVGGLLTGLASAFVLPRS